MYRSEVTVFVDSACAYGSRSRVREIWSTPNQGCHCDTGACFFDGPKSYFPVSIRSSEVITGANEQSKGRVRLRGQAPAAYFQSLQEGAKKLNYGPRGMQNAAKKMTRGQLLTEAPRGCR